MALGVQKIGLIAGGGNLPRHVIAGCKSQDLDLFVAPLAGFAPKDIYGDVKPFGLGEFGRLIKTLKSEGCDAICFAGNVSRPDFRTLVPDWGGVKLLPRAIKAAKNGDDALLSFIVSALEAEGFTIVAPQDVCGPLISGQGVMTVTTPTEAAYKDAIKALRVARRIGAMDIGQGAVVCEGLILAVEAQEGTDWMIERVAKLSSDIRGTVNSRRGVIGKILKPGQESRLDLPTIGMKTIEGAVIAGLAGIAVEAGGAFMLDKADLIERADAEGLFILGVPLEDIGSDV